MNLNDFVVLPNKPKSVKLNPSRNMRELRMETVQLAQESAAMESRLKQLRENMSREKEERERSGGIRWKSGQAGPLSGGPTARRNRENAATTAAAAAAAMPKVPGAKVKIRVLKDEPLPELPRRPVERPSVAGGGGGEQMPSRRPQLKGRACGQCEAREAGLMCPECGEDYCIGCFAKFHQKGALKLHRMIPIQAAVQTSVSALDVVQRFQKQVGTDSPKLSSAPTGDRKRTGEATWRSSEVSGPSIHYPVPSGSHEGTPTPTDSEEEEDEEEEEEEEDDLEEEEMKGRNVSPPGGSSLLQGSFDEEESARSFQQALQQWRRGGGGEQEEEEEASGEGVEPADSQQHRQRACRPRSDALPVSVEATGTQASLHLLQPARPIQVEFKQHGLTYMEKLLIKKHRRTPIEEYRPLSSEASSSSSTSTVAQEPLTPSHSSETDGESHRLTEEEKEMRSYLLSLFAVTPRGGAREVPSPEPCISPLPPQPTVTIVELDQTVGDSAGTSAFGVERRQVNTKSREGVSESVMNREREKRDRVGSAGSSASSSLRELRLAPGGQPSSPTGKWPAAAPAPPPPRPFPRTSPPSLGHPRANSQHPSPPPPPCSVQSSSSSGQLPAKMPTGRLSHCPKSDKMKTSSVEDGRSAKSRLKESPSKTPSPRSRLATITPPGSSESQSANTQISPKTPSPRGMLTPSPRLGISKIGLTPSPPPQPRPSADPRHQSPPSSELRSTISGKRFQTPSPRGTLTPSPCLGSSKDLLTPSPPAAHVTSAAPPQTSSPSETQSTDPLYTPSPSRLSSPGLRRPVEASTPVSSMEMTPEMSVTETVSFRLLPGDSSSPHAPVVPPLDITSTPPSAEHSTLSSHRQHSALPMDSDCGLEEEKEEEEEDEEEDEREEDWRGSVGLLLDQSDSSDEEMRRCGDGPEEAVLPLYLSSPRPPSCPPDGSQCSGRSVEEGPSTPSAARTPNHEPSRMSESPLFTQPSSALQALAQRQPIQPHGYLGLDGFLTLGVEGTSARQGSAPVEANSARQSSAPVSASTRLPHQHGAASLYSGGQHLSWRPCSSLRESAPEELVMAVLESQSPRGPHSSRPASSTATHSRPTTPASATHRLLATGRCTPRSPRCPMSVSSRPVSHSTSRPMSRAAQEIEEVQSVEREVLLGGGDLQEEEEEEQEDRQALASLEEEFRRMSTAQPGTGLDLGSSGVPTPVARGTAVGHRSSAGRSWSGGSGGGSSSSMARRQSSVGHPDEEEEEEQERDKQSVLALR